MTLQVPFERFVESVRRVLGADEAYVSPHPEGSVVTAANPARTGAVAAVAPLPPDRARAVLEAEGLVVAEGEWIADNKLRSIARPLDRLSVAAVAYPAANGKVGLWVDAFDHEPTEREAVQTMHEEFVATGQIPAVTLEEFLKAVPTTVVIARPEDLLAYAATRPGESPMV